MLEKSCKNCKFYMPMDLYFGKCINNDVKILSICYTEYPTFAPKFGCKFHIFNNETQLMLAQEQVH